MKTGNAIKIILVVSIVILLSLISFLGIYVKKTNSYENIVPNYSFGMDLGKKRVVTLKVNDGTSTVIRDSEGKKVSSIPEGEDESKYTKEEEKINKDEVLTEDNYEKAKKIIEERLKRISADGYSIKYSKKTGDIIVELPENDVTDDCVNVLTATGKFELVSKDTEEVLLSNNDLKKATVSYYNETSGTTVYLTIKLNKEGTKKLREISNTYVKNEDKKDESADSNTTTDNTINVTTSSKNKDKETNTTTDTTTEQATENSTENEEEGKQAILRLDWPSYTGALTFSDVVTQAFEEPITDGTFQLRIGTASTNESLQQYFNQARQIASILNSGLNEIQYTTDNTRIVESEISQLQITVAICVLIALVAIISIVLIVMYKGLGLTGIITNIAMIACTLIFIRLTNVIVTINAFTAIFVLLIVNTLIIAKLIENVKNNDNSRTAIWKAILESIDLLVVLLEISIVFIFMAGEAIISAGMILFWGIISIILTNLLLTRPLLLSVNKNK